jgi:hypothetical protein
MKGKQKGNGITKTLEAQCLRFVFHTLFRVLPFIKNTFMDMDIYQKEFAGKQARL